MFYLIIFVVFFLGISIGSFINAFEWRLYRNQSILTGRSQCRYCEYVLRAVDLFPLLSFILLRAKCRNCKKKISWQYPLVELSLGILFVLVFLHVNNWQLFFASWSGFLSFMLIREWLIVTVLSFLFIFDLKYYILPDIITLPSLLIMVIIGLILNFVWGVNDFSLVKYSVGILFGAGFFYLQYLISKGRWVGGGDIRFGALMGAMLSWPLVLLALFISYIFGSGISIFLLMNQKKTMKSVIPFGTFLAIGTLVSLFWGNEILTWYLGYLY